MRKELPMEKVINIEKINRAVMTGTPEEVIELCKFIHIEIKTSCTERIAGWTLFKACYWIDIKKFQYSFPQKCFK